MKTRISLAFGFVIFLSVCFFILSIVSFTGSKRQQNAFITREGEINITVTSIIDKYSGRITNYQKELEALETAQITREAEIEITVTSINDELSGKNAELAATGTANTSNYIKTLTAQATAHQIELETAMPPTISPLPNCENIVKENVLETSDDSCNFRIYSALPLYQEVVAGEEIIQSWIIDSRNSNDPSCHNITKLQQVDLKDEYLERELSRTNNSRNYAYTSVNQSEFYTEFLRFKGKKEVSGYYYSCWQIYLENGKRIFPLLPVIVEIVTDSRE